MILKVDESTVLRAFATDPVVNTFACRITCSMSTQCGGGLCSNTKRSAKCPSPVNSCMHEAQLALADWILP